MTIFYLWKIPFILGLFVLSIYVLSKNNDFARAKNTLFRFFISIFVVWVCMILLRGLVNVIDPILATSEAEHREVMADGGKNIMVLLFGWAYGVIVSLFSWFVIRTFHLMKFIKGKYFS